MYFKYDHGRLIKTDNFCRFSFFRRSEFISKVKGKRISAQTLCPFLKPMYYWVKEQLRNIK